ncbi:MAG: hypothetical protein ABJB12_13460 [Pseudomonadota bacterium]
MERSLPRLLTATGMCACAGLLAVASCTRTTDRVVEPVGGGDASTTVPDVSDASATPIGPVARPPAKEDGEPEEDFRLARSPALGARVGSRAGFHLAQARVASADNALGGTDAGGSAGNGGAGGRAAPVGAGARSN